MYGTNSAARLDGDATIMRMLEEPGGLAKIASEGLPALIREKRDYVGFARKILVVDPVTAERLIKHDDDEYYVQYDKDLNARAAFYGNDPDIPEQKIEGETLRVCILTISSDNAVINLKRLYIEKSLYLDRAKEVSGHAIAALEDTKVLRLTEALIAGTSVDLKVPENALQVVTTVDTALLKTHLVSLKKTHTQHDLITENFVMHPATLDDILSWSDDQVDEQTRRELIEQGVRYSIWGSVNLITSKIIPLNIVYAFAEKQYTGVIPVLKDIDVEITETKERMIKGLFQYEWLGFALFNVKAVGKLILSYVSGTTNKTTVYDAIEKTM